MVDRLPAVEASGAPGRGTLDPFAVLAATAAVTSRVRIGTGVVVAPRYRATVLARMLTSLDVTSDGRLVAGIGPGSEQAGRRARDLETVLDVLDAEWTGGDEQWRAADGARGGACQTSEKRGAPSSDATRAPFAT